MPAVTNIALTGGTWLTADGGAALVDGKPARVARLQASGTPAIALTFASSFVPRIIGVLGLRGVAPGAAVRVTSPAGLGGNAGTATAVRFADGTVGTWIVTAGTVSTAALTVSIAGSGQVDVGEIAAMPAVEIPIDAGWSQVLIDPSEIHRSRSGQVAATPRPAYRDLQVVYSLAKDHQVRGGGLAGGLDWEQLATRISGGRRCVAVPRWRTAGALDPSKVNRTAMYGIAAELGEIEHVRGPWWRQAAAFQEIPALPV